MKITLLVKFYCTIFEYLSDIFDDYEFAGTQHPLDKPILPIFVTIDPARDTIGQLKYYSRDFDPRFTWLTGTVEQLTGVAKDFRVYVGKVSPSTSYNW